MSIFFRYAAPIRSAFPELSTRTLHVQHIDATADIFNVSQRFTTIASERLSQSNEGNFIEIQAWRRTFSKMGLKPTQYRCASESLLRRFRKEGILPSLHPLVDLCNTASLAYGIPIAVFDSEQIGNGLEVRPATGQETYEAFSGKLENPEAGEIIFADQHGRAHARRWSNRQSGYSAVQKATTSALIVAEALHETAADDLSCLATELSLALHAVWPRCEVSSLSIE